MKSNLDEKLFTVKRMANRYGCSIPTARKYIRECVPYYENPLVAPEWAVKEWEEKRMRIPPETSRKAVAEIIRRNNAERIIVPRQW